MEREPETYTVDPFIEDTEHADTQPTVPVGNAATGASALVVAYWSRLR